MKYFLSLIMIIRKKKSIKINLRKNISKKKKTLNFFLTDATACFLKIQRNLLSSLAWQKNEGSQNDGQIGGTLNKQKC